MALHGRQSRLSSTATARKTCYFPKPAEIGTTKNTNYTKGLTPFHFVYFVACLVPGCVAERSQCLELGLQQVPQVAVQVLEDGNRSMAFLRRLTDKNHSHALVSVVVSAEVVP